MRPALLVLNNLPSTNDGQIDETAQSCHLDGRFRQESRNRGHQIVHLPMCLFGRYRKPLMAADGPIH